MRAIKGGIESLGKKIVLIRYKSLYIGIGSI